MKPMTSEEIVKLCNSVQNIAGQIDKREWLSADEVKKVIDEWFKVQMGGHTKYFTEADLNNLKRELGLSGEKK